MNLLATSLSTGGRSAVLTLRKVLTTTPGRLRVESVVIVAVAALAGLLTSIVISDRLGESRRIANEAEPVTVSARQIQTNLAEANAAAATAFLAGGVENPAQRQIYEESLTTAAAELEAAARLTGTDDEAHQALTELTAALPRYAGLIETARASNRQGFPVGAAYLDSASTLLEEDIYPNTDLVANRAAEEYRQAYDRLRGPALATGAVAVLLALALAVVLIYVQVQLRRRFNRSINLPIAIATIAALALIAWSTYGLVDQNSHLTEARDDGHQGTRLYLDIRGNGFGAKADEARFLIARGAGEDFEVSFDDRATRIEGIRSDLDDHAAQSADGDAARAEADQIHASWASYAQVHEEVVSADRAGDREGAVATALGPSDTAFAEFDRLTSQALDANQARFAAEMDQAEGALRGLQIGSLLAVALIAVLSAYGLQLRINEYR